MRKALYALVFMAFCPLLVAQQALNNDAVIKLVKAGLSDDLIISTINAQPGIYDVSPDGLIALKTGGASDKVVAALVSRAAGPTPSATGAPPTTSTTPAMGDPDDPAMPHDPGIYLMNTTRDGRQKRVRNP
jgi:hypothetical protein